MNLRKQFEKEIGQLVWCGTQHNVHAREAYVEWLEKKLDEYEKENKQLREYVHHKPDCELNHYVWTKNSSNNFSTKYKDPQLKCTCRLNELINKIKE
jgi:hypothetical protein